MLKIIIDQRKCQSEAAIELAGFVTALLRRTPEIVDIDIIGQLMQSPTPVLPIAPKVLEPAAGGAQAGQPEVKTVAPALVAAPAPAPRRHIIIDRIDFVPAGARCGVCHRPITSGSAYVVKDGEKEYPCGPSCITTLVPGFKDYILPDLTRASISDLAEGDEKVAKPKKSGQNIMGEEEYLHIRYQKLTGFKFPRNTELDSLAARYFENGTLLAGDRAFVARELKKIFFKKPALTLSNLQACYAFDHFLGEAISRLRADKQGYLKDIQDGLRRKLFLSEGQVKAANRWLSKLPGMPELDPTPFGWATAKPKAPAAPAKTPAAAAPEAAAPAPESAPAKPAKKAKVAKAKPAAENPATDTPVAADTAAAPADVPVAASTETPAESSAEIQTEKPAADVLATGSIEIVVETPDVPAGREELAQAA